MYKNTILSHKVLFKIWDMIDPVGWYLNAVGIKYTYLHDVYHLNSKNIIYWGKYLIDNGKRNYRGVSVFFSLRNRILVLYRLSHLTYKPLYTA